MKKFLAFYLVFVLMGCSYGLDEYVEDPRTILRDPLSVDHRQALNDLERAHLQKKITYAEYLEQKQQIEEDFDRDVKQRRDIVENVR